MNRTVETLPNGRFRVIGTPIRGITQADLDAAHVCEECGAERDSSELRVCLDCAAKTIDAGQY